MLHVIPVPDGWSPEQSWEHIQRAHLIPNEAQTWVIVETDEKDGFLRVVR